MTETNNQQNIINNWTEVNINTLRAWKESLSKASFIYQILLEEKKTKLNKIMFICLILSTISTIVTGISSMALTINNDLYKAIALGINICVFILSAVISCLNGAIKLLKLDDTVLSYSTYIEKLDKLYSIIANELILPDNLREDAITFIKKQSDTYLNLISESPDVDASDYQHATSQYTLFLRNDGINFKCSQKYKNNDMQIEVI